MTEEVEILIEENRLWEYVDSAKPKIEAALRENLPLAPPHIETRFNEALEYALFPGGKLLRPVLTLLGAEIAGGKAESVINAAAAVEFIHTSSLIFDDLPAMDNAHLRRGKKSLHEEYGEGLAILVAVALLNSAYGLIFANPAVPAERQVFAHRELVDCIGASGLVGGQSVDLAISGQAASENLESIKNLKTSALMRLALRVGAILSGADYLQLAVLSRFAELLGDAYQASDDLIDLAEDAGIANDSGRGQTFANSFGSSEAAFRLSRLVSQAKELLIHEFPANNAAHLLCDMADYIAERKS